MSPDLQPSLELVSRSIASLTGETPGELTFSFRPLRGGLSAPAVAGLRASYRDRSGRRRRARLVLKYLGGSATRERRIYEDIVAAHAASMSPRLIGAVDFSAQRAAILLESVRRLTWPWRDPRAAQVVLERLASFHVSARASRATPAVADWDYEAALRGSAERTYESLLECRARPELAVLVKAAPATKRLVLALPQCRAALLGVQPFGPCVVHGDVHPGNVLIRSGGSRFAPVLIDWERARPGSALEDVSSWLQSLGFWEPEARRRHDTSFASYLSALGLERRLSSSLRAAYWIAGASNALAGALDYHLRGALHSLDGGQRAACARAALSWLRVLRRADAFWS